MQLLFIWGLGVLGGEILEAAPPPAVPFKDDKLLLKCDVAISVKLEPIVTLFAPLVVVFVPPGPNWGVKGSLAQDAMESDI